MRIYREVELNPPGVPDPPAADDETHFDKLQSRAARVTEFDRVVREQIRVRREELQKNNQPEPVIGETEEGPFEGGVDELELKTKSLNSEEAADPTQVHKTAAEAMRATKKAELERKTPRKRRNARRNIDG